VEPSAPPSRRPGAATAGLQGFGVVVRDATAAAVRRGHPWVYRDGVSHLAPDLRAGDAVTLGDATGAPLGIGVVDPDSPIAVRVWSLDPRATLAELFGARLERALARRDALFDERTTAYRLVHGEGDRMPGIVVDRYGDVAVVRADGEAAAAVLERNGRALSAALVGRGLPRIVVKSRGAEAAMWGGGAAPADVRVLEHGVPFFVDVARVYALRLGIAECGTVARLEAVAEAGQFTAKEAAGWIDAFRFLQALRIKGQAEALRVGGTPGHRVDPDDLNDLDRRMLLESLRQAAKLQKRLALDFSLDN
jgi:hypothetical protein